MTPNEIAAALTAHDWYFNQSDDIRVFEKGLENEARLMRELSGHKFEDIEPLLDEFTKKQTKYLYVRIGH